MECAHEGLNGFASDCVVVRVAFGLHINPVEPQCVLIDHAINAAVARTANTTPSLFRAAVAHREEQLDHCFFEEVGMALTQPLGECCAYIVLDPVYPVLNLLDGFKFFHHWNAGGQGFFGLYLLLGLGPVLGEELMRLAVVDSIWVVLKPLSAGIGDAVVALGWPADPVGAREVAEDPPHPLFIMQSPELSVSSRADSESPAWSAA